MNKTIAELRHDLRETNGYISFNIETLENDVDNAKICKASISLSHDLGLRFVAEGVETKEQARYLIDNACDVLQGYYFCRPVNAAAAFSFIHDYQQEH